MRDLRQPVRVVVESEIERILREDRRERTNVLLARIEREERARWGNVRQMLSWVFAMWDRMEGANAIDPSRESVQGVQVDRDERIVWLARVKHLLVELARMQGNTRGVRLVWLHFRVPSQVGHVRDDDGRRRVVFGNAGVAIRELHDHDGEPVSRRETIADFWRAVLWLESTALERGWISGRLPPQGPRRSNVMRRVRPPSGDE